MPPKRATKKVKEVEIEEKKVHKPLKQFKPKQPKELNSENDIARRIFVNPEDRITDNVLHPPELARLIALRAKLFSINQLAFTKITDQVNEKQVAIKELLDKKFPLNLIRRIGKDKDGNEICEEFNVNEMVIPSLPILEQNV